MNTHINEQKWTPDTHTKHQYLHTTLFSLSVKSWLYKHRLQPCSWNPWPIGGIRARNEPWWISHHVTFWIIISLKTAHYKNVVSLSLSLCFLSLSLQEMKSTTGKDNSHLVYNECIWLMKYYSTEKYKMCCCIRIELVYSSVMFSWAKKKCVGKEKGQCNRNCSFRKCSIWKRLLHMR